VNAWVRPRSDDHIGRRRHVIKVDVTDRAGERSAGRSRAAGDHLSIGEVPPVGRPRVAVEEGVGLGEPQRCAAGADEKERRPAFARDRALCGNERSIG
jgi:hypothetical protein